MMSLFRVLFVIALCPLAFPLQATDESHDHEVAAYLKLENALAVSQEEAHYLISVANWAEATKIELLLDDDFYQPDKLSLEAGKAYVLDIKNVGAQRHDISSERFFANIVVRRLQHEGLTVSAYHLESISMSAGDVVRVELLTMTAGEFPFICTVQNHLHEGMEGLLTVTSKSSGNKAATDKAVTEKVPAEKINK